MLKKLSIVVILFSSIIFAQNDTHSIKNQSNAKTQNNLNEKELNKRLFSFDIEIQNYILEKYQLEIFKKIRELLLRNNVIMAYNLFNQLKPMNVSAYKDYYYFFLVLKKFKNDNRVPEIKFIKNPFLVFKFFEISIYISNNYNKIYRLIKILNYYRKNDKLHLITNDDYNRLYALLFKILGSNTMSLYYLNKIENKTIKDKEKISLLYKALVEIENSFLKLTKTDINTITLENINIYRVTVPKPILKISF